MTTTDALIAALVSLDPGLTLGRSTPEAYIRDRFVNRGACLVAYELDGQPFAEIDINEEPSSYTGPHGTVRTIDGKVYGRIGTLRSESTLPAMSVEREREVRAHYEAEYERAYAAIVAEYPEAADGRRDMGEIEIDRP